MSARGFMPARSSGLLDGTAFKGSGALSVWPTGSSAKNTTLTVAPLRSPIGRRRPCGRPVLAPHLTWLWNQPSQATHGLPEARAKSNGQNPAYCAGDDDRDYKAGNLFHGDSRGHP